MAAANLGQDVVEDAAPDLQQQAQEVRVVVPAPTYQEYASNYPRGVDPLRKTKPQSILAETRRGARACVCVCRSWYLTKPPLPIVLRTRPAVAM
jgi:hypothetical protein